MVKLENRGRAPPPRLGPGASPDVSRPPEGARACQSGADAGRRERAAVKRTCDVPAAAALNVTPIRIFHRD